MLLKIGTLIFNFNTLSYQELRRTTSYRWQAQQLIGPIPAQQYLGPDTEIITLSGVIYPKHTDGLNQLKKLKQLAHSGKTLPLSLIDSEGNLYGKWCVKKITETGQYFTQDMVPLKVEFSIELLQYSEPGQ